MTRADQATLALASLADVLLASGSLSPWLFGPGHAVLVLATLSILHRAACDGRAPALPAWVAAAFGPATGMLILALPLGGSEGGCRSPPHPA